MIDSHNLISTIEAQISKDVDQIIRHYVEHQIKQLTINPDWLAKMDGHIRDAITRLLTKQINDIDLSEKIAQEIQNASDRIQTLVVNTAEQTVQQHVQDVVQLLAVDQTWIAKMEQHINESIARRFGNKLSLIDVNDMVMKAIEPSVELYFDRRRAAGHGIDDQATGTQLTVTDDGLKISESLESKNITVTGDAHIRKTLTVQNLAVLGSVNTDNKTWQELSAAIASATENRLTQDWREKIVQDVVNQIQANGIKFDDIKVGDSQLIDGDRLGTAIRLSSLTQVGTLDSLKVTGDVDLSRSLSVRPRRVGINTEHPDMALAVWDEEVALVFGKQKDQTAYMGTLRPQRLMIGVNRSGAIEIDDRGRVAVNHLTVGRHRICHEPECPNYSGTKGDIVFNSNPKNDGIWGWQCLGAFRWVPLRTA